MAIAAVETANLAQFLLSAHFLFLAHFRRIHQWQLACIGWLASWQFLVCQNTKHWILSLTPPEWMQ